MFAYLFERFPSFTQTFCAREAAALRNRGLVAEIFSIRNPVGEPVSQDFPDAGTAKYLPSKFDNILASDPGFRKASRRAQKELVKLWGDEQEKYRIYEALWLKQACREAGITHLHVHFAGLAARTAFWLKQCGGPNYSVTAHANDIFRDEPPERLAQVLGLARCVVTVSDFSRRFLEESIPKLRGRVHRVYNGMEMAGFSRMTFPQGKPLILAIGRAIEKKGFGDLLAACALMRERDFECLIVGGGPLEEDLRRQIATLGLSEKVAFLGPRNMEEIRGLLARSRVFALPCVTGADGAMDNLPTVIMEAMACALPVVSTPLAGIPEMVVDGETGRLVPEKSPEALAAALSVYLDDPALAQSHGEAGLQRCRDLFSIGKTSEALIGILRNHGAFGG